MNTFKTLLKAFGIGIAVLIAFSLPFTIIDALQRQVTPSEPTQQATTATHRNSFVSGCKQEATKELPSVTPAQIEAFCGCAYDKFIVMYPDFATNSERMNRIMTEGYSSTETDAIVPCADTLQV